MNKKKVSKDEEDEKKGDVYGIKVSVVMKRYYTRCTISCTFNIFNHSSFALDKFGPFACPKRIPTHSKQPSVNLWKCVRCVFITSEHPLKVICYEL